MGTARHAGYLFMSVGTVRYSSGSPSGLTGPCHRSVACPAATVTGAGNYYVYSETEYRKLTVRENARLQTFPDDHPWQGNVGQSYQQVGNAVPPLLAQAVLRMVHDE